MLIGMQAELEEALEELRSLAHGVYPPVLMDYGLSRALSAACRRSSVRISLQAQASERYPREIEGAVYFSCLEALQNVEKHAGADACASVRLWQQEGWLHFEVRDFGAGFDVSRARNRVGLTNMRDRVEALEGTFSVLSAVGAGTIVAGAVPLRRSDEDG
jgi:signal transduction histidine kinase